MNRPNATSRAARAATINALKDAIGVFAIMTMLYVGLFIPSI